MNIQGKATMATPAQNMNIMRRRVRTQLTRGESPL